ncbi:hypothetical protein FS749_015761, partial [Ceratobasidium sp. UAMH 11750]
MSGGSAPSLFGYYPHALPHSRVSHSDPSYPPSSSYLNSNNYSGSVSTGSGGGSTTTNSYTNAGTSYVQAESTVGVAGPSAPSDLVASGDSLAGSSKRPFPFPLGSQERDKRARSCEGHNASGSGMVRNGSGLWEGAGGTWTQGQAVPEGEGRGGSGSGGDATIVGDGGDVGADEEADVDSSIGEAQIDEDEATNQETSSYASAAESPQPTQFPPRGPLMIENRLSNTIPFSAASTYARTSPSGAGAFPIDASSSSYPMEPMANATHNRRASPAPRIPTPAALRSSSPFDLPILSPTSGSSSTPATHAFPNVGTPQSNSFPGARDTHPAARLPPLRSPSSSGLDRLPPLSMHALTGQESDSPSEPESAMRPRPGLFDMEWMTRQYDQMSESRGPEPIALPTLEVDTSRPQESPAGRPGASHSRPDFGNVERSGRALRALPVARLSASPSFVLPESPTFPVSASPRTSTFDLAVTPPGSALPSFVARMMEVDSPVREGADGLGHAYTIPELVLEPRAENDAASIDALRRFARSANGTSPNEASAGSYFAESPDPEIRREPIRFPLESLRTAEDLSARALREFDQSNDVAEQAPLFPPPREESEVAQQGSSTLSQPGSSAFAQASSSTFSTGTNSTAHQLDESGPMWSSRPPDLQSQRLTESGVSYPSRPSASDTSFPSFRANVSPEPELNLGFRPGRLVRDMSWSFSDVFRPGHEGSIEALSGSGSEINPRPHEQDERTEGDNRGTRAGARNALTRAARLAGPTRGNESLPRLHLNALPRVSGAESSATQDEQSQSWSAMTASTNLSRTPP